MIVVGPRVAKKAVDKVKRLKIHRTERSRKNKKQTRPRVAKKSEGGDNYVFSYQHRISTFPICLVI